MNFSDFTGYVLAGGKSSRMGRDKAFLKFGEKTFLENAVEILKPNCKNVKIVLNKSQIDFISKLPDQIPHIFDVYQNRGALGGIHAAFKDCETEFAAILAVDLPFVTSEAIAKLCETAVYSKEFAAIVPRQYDEKLQPLCAVYHAENCLPKLEEVLLKNESVSVREFLETIQIKIIDEEILSNDEKFLANINNQKDFEQVLYRI